MDRQRPYHLGDTEAQKTAMADKETRDKEWGRHGKAGHKELSAGFARNRPTAATDERG